MRNRFLGCLLRAPTLTLVALLAGGAAFGASPDPSPSASNGGADDGSPRPLPPVEEVSYTDVAEAELELIAELRADAQFADRIGPDGSAILGSLDAATRAHGEASMSVFADELGQEVEGAGL